MKNFKLISILVPSLLLLSSLTTTINAQCFHQTLITSMTQAFNQRDTSQLDDHYQEDAKIYHAADTLVGVAAIQAGYENYFTRMPNAVQTIDDTICTNDKLVIRWTLTGTPQNAATQLTLTGINVYHLENGKISEEWASTDFMSVVRQLGYTLKAPDAGGE